MAVNAKFIVTQVLRTAPVQANSTTNSIAITAVSVNAVNGDNGDWSLGAPIGQLTMTITNSALFSSITEGMVLQLTLAPSTWSTLIT